MVNFNVLRVPAHFTGIGEQSCDKLAACPVEHAWNLIVQHRLVSPPERDAPEVGDEGLLPVFSFDRHLEALHWAMGRFDG